MWRDPASKVDALDLDKTVIRADRRKLQRLIKVGRYPGGLKIVNDKSHQRSFQTNKWPLPHYRLRALLRMAQSAPP